MTSTYSRPRYALLAIIVGLLTMFTALATQANADNSKEAHRVVVCTYTYNGTPYRYELADLDVNTPSSDRASIERMMQRWALVETAGQYNHEYANYPEYPKSVQPSDLHNWRCVWTEGNTAP